MRFNLILQHYPNDMKFRISQEELCCPIYSLVLLQFMQSYYKRTCYHVDPKNIKPRNYNVEVEI